MAKEEVRSKAGCDRKRIHLIATEWLYREPLVTAGGGRIGLERTVLKREKRTQRWEGAETLRRKTKLAKPSAIQRCLNRK
ncbi:hypothetical protein CGZ80_26685 [Rhodopirellula sp. MGV]|nr:hypothetical protein CGZ80_26685 [Rhodopirellula sp. MGV]PNY38725.1 hypothetical protein C2E31_02105 [Rhodopirellula baltica]